MGLSVPKRKVRLAAVWGTFEAALGSPLATPLISMSQFALIAANIVVPVGALFANVMVRAKKGLSQTTGADVLLLLAVFDTILLMSPGDFVPLIRDASIQEDFTVFVGVGWWVVLAAWLLTVLFLEDKSQPDHSGYHRTPSVIIGATRFIVSWLLVFGLISSHVLIFRLDLSG